MAPPQLARDVPVADVLHPVVVDLGEALRNDGDSPILHGLERRRQRAVSGGQTTARTQAARRCRASAGNGRQSGRSSSTLTSKPSLCSCSTSVLRATKRSSPAYGPAFSFIVPSRFITLMISKLVALADLVVGRIVARRHLDGAGAEGRVDGLIGNDLDAPAEHGQYGVAAHQLCVALVARVHGDGAIAQDGFRPGGGHRDVLIGRAFKVVAHRPQVAVGILVLHLEVADGGTALGAPVDQPLALVDPALVVEADKGIAHSFGALLRPA